jgi:molybdopterin converting factor small subunit
MQIEVKLYGDAKKHAPGEKAQFQMTLQPGATLKDALHALAIPSERYTSLINGRRADDDVLLKDGDTLVSFPLVSGG